MAEQVSAQEELRFDESEAGHSETRHGGADAAGVAGGGGARYKLMSPGKLPISRSACLTIPPGLSPTSFLESPVLLSNIKAEPSPTTGSLFKPQPVHASISSISISGSTVYSNNFDDRKNTDFEFRPSGPTMTPAESNQQRGVQYQGQYHGFSFTPALVSGVSVSSSELDGPATPQAPDSDEVNPSQNDHRGTTTILADDGYNWRKYGQKQVKGSEFPRSYYKCTHPNCEVKKLFERSHDGQITEIVYKGTHDHPKPQPNRRNSSGIVMPAQEERLCLVSPLTGQDDNRSNIYNHMSLHTEQNGNHEAAANDDSEEVAASYRNNDDMDADDPLSKRRKMDCGIEVTPLVKPIREPRVVVQTLSEVDILDDGYRWRKYGQKVVRGNPNPRSYYKCTAAGCPVRKHVERASHDPKAVITTYEGKHNHEVPTAKSTCQNMSGNGAPRLRPDESDPISLDLGVGRNSSNNNSSNEHQQQQQHSQFLHTQVSGSNFRFSQATPIAHFYNALNTGINPSGSRENPTQAPTDDLSSLNHSSYPFPQSIGRIQSGP